MNHKFLTHWLVGPAFVASSLAVLSPIADACTRCVYLGPKDTVLVARSMDWLEDPGTNLFSFPRGMKRHGAAGPNSVTWTSKHGSVVCSFYEIASVDGMNEKGLVAGVLYLAESDYGKPNGKQTISIAAWAQYVLDNFTTVGETVQALRQEPFVVVAPVLPNGTPAQGHLAISDPTGDSAIFEYVKGKLVIHHGRECQVMTNSPIYDQQIALNSYWKQIGGETMLPGTSRAADRFARASFYINAVVQTENAEKAIAAVFSVIRTVSVPAGIKTPGHPDVAGTVWRTLYDHKNRVFFFDSATSPTIFWTPLAKMDFNEGAPVKKLTLTGGKTYSGDASAQYVDSMPFEFLPAKVD